MDFLIGLQLLYVNLQAVDLGIPPRHQCMLSVVWSLGYVVGSQFAGRLCTPKNSGVMMRLSLCGSAAAICLIYLVQPHFGLYLGASACIGLLIGFYFTPFQVKMGHIHPFRRMATAVAIYNMSWGLGFALGAIGCGWIMDLPGTKWIASGLVVATAAAQFILLGFVDGKDGHAEKSAQELTSTFASTPLQRSCCRVCLFATLVIFSGINATLWPNLGREVGMSSFQIGIGGFAMFLPIPLFALLWARIGERIHSPVILIGGLMTTGLGCLVMLLSSEWLWQLTVLIAMGVGYSCVNFHGMFYANADPVTRERSVGMNETVVGCAAVVGPSLMGWLAWDSGASRLPYAVGFGLAIIACVLIAGMWLSGRHREARAKI
jgi:MFS family permease